MAEKPSDIQEAMTLVLQAERDAEQAVAACETQARELIVAAQKQADRILSRADERITLMKMRSRQRLAGEIRQRQRDATTALEQQTPAFDEQRLRACVADIAEALTSGEPD